MIRTSQLFVIALNLICCTPKGAEVCQFLDLDDSTIISAYGMHHIHHR